MDSALLLPLTATGLGLVSLASLPAWLAIWDQVKSRAPKDNFYEDTDGKATPESIAAFTNQPQKAVVLALSLVGLGTSTGVSVLSQLHSVRDRDLPLDNWLLTAVWVRSLQMGAESTL